MSNYLACSVNENMLIRPHDNMQELIFKLETNRAILADPPGSGKSYMILGLICMT
jgi:hypothetical protein